MENMVVAPSLSYYKGKRVFVTGHTGFKGAWLITWLHSLGAIVKGYALQPGQESSLFNIIAPKIDFENIFGDIRDKEKLQAELQNFQPDIVFHLAAQALVRRSYEIPAETFEINTTGTANLLEAVSNLPGKCAVIVVTTDKVYENREANYHYKESDELGGYDPYSASKAAAEIVVSSFRNAFFNPMQYEMHQKAVASARAGNVIGGGDWNKDRIIPDTVRALMAGQAVPVRNPNSVRPWQHVLEPLCGYLQLGILLSNDAGKFSGAYNFGPLADDHLPVRELVDIALDCWGSGEWADQSNESQPHEAGLLHLDINKAKTELNWQPKLSGREAIRWTIDWYRQSPGNIYPFTLEQVNNYQQR
jgi:CDP-glucose 4,6-dehydratase